MLLLLSRFAIIATVGAIAYSGLRWWYRIWPLLHRLHYTAVTVCPAFFDPAGWYPGEAADMFLPSATQIQ